MTSGADQFLEIIRNTKNSDLINGSWLRSAIRNHDVSFPNDTSHSVQTSDTKKRHEWLNLLCQILKEVYPILQSETFCLKKEGEWCIFGDILGSWNNLQPILCQMSCQDNFLTLPIKGPNYLFTGNIINKNPQNILCLFVLLALKIKYPEKLILLAGIEEHQMEQAFSVKSPTFFEELLVYLSIEKSYDWYDIKWVIHELQNQSGQNRMKALKQLSDSWVWTFFGNILHVVRLLPIVAVINTDIFICSGGCFEDNLKCSLFSTRIEMIEKMTKTMEYEDETYTGEMKQQMANAHYQLFLNHPVMPDDPYHEDLKNHGKMDETGWMKASFYKSTYYKFYSTQAVNRFLQENGFKCLIRGKLMDTLGSIPPEMNVFTVDSNHLWIHIHSDGSIHSHSNHE